MSEHNTPCRQEPAGNSPLPANSEGGLRAPPGLTSWGKAWWWFHFLILVKLARLRFIAILLAIGLVIVNWDTLMAYYDKWTRTAAHEHAAHSDVEYFCPMHPAIIRESSKEKCPICRMPLSRRKKGDDNADALPPGVVNRVQLSPYRVVLAGIKTSTVTYLPLSKEIKAVGSVEFNEREMKQVAARVKGRLDKLFVNETGEMVHAGDELASIYSPDLTVTVQNLLDALSTGNTGLQQVTRDRLQLWGISKDQVDEIEKTRKANSHLKIRSPINGHVIKKYVKEGQYVEEGSPLYDIVDLSTVWIQGQVYEDDMAFLPDLTRPQPNGKALKDKKFALPVMASTRAAPSEKFDGWLTFVYPHVDQETRTVVVRFELANPHHKLRPGSSATVTLKVPPRQVPLLLKELTEDWITQTAGDSILRALASPGVQLPDAGVAPLLRVAIQNALIQHGHVLAVPDSAIIDTGSLQLVYREVLPGQYEGVRVELGPRMVGPSEATFFPVLRGLQPGDRIVTDGSFLVDAETRLNPAAGSIYFGGSSGGKGGGATSSTVRPSTPEDKETTTKAALAKLTQEDRRLVEAQQYCPILKNSRLGSMGVPVKLTLEGQAVFVCCSECEKEARANPRQTATYVQELITSGKRAEPRLPQPPLTPELDQKIKAALAKLSPEDRKAVEQQKLCPVTNAPLGSMAGLTKVMIQGQPVWVCCEGCSGEVEAQPAQTLKKVRELKAKNATPAK